MSEPEVAVFWIFRIMKKYESKACHSRDCEKKEGSEQCDPTQAAALVKTLEAIPAARDLMTREARCLIGVDCNACEYSQPLCSLLSQRSPKPPRPPKLCRLSITL